MMKRKKISRFLAIGLCGAVLAGCSATGDSTADTSATESAETQSMDTTSSESSSVASNAINSSGKKDSNENNSELTEEEAKDRLFEYLEENNSERAENFETYDLLIKEEGRNFQISLFPHTTSDDEQGGAMIARYNVERETGNVEEVTSNDDTEPYISELIDFSDKERRAHHEKLAGGPEYIQDKVYEHLMLPGIHENTKKYEGRINPGERIRFTFPDAEKFHERSIYDPEISEDGYFTINLNAYEFKAGQDILVSITGGYPEEQTFNLTVNEAQKGMEDIRVRE